MSTFTERQAGNAAEADDESRGTVSARTQEALFKWGGLGMIFLSVAFAMGLAIDRGLLTAPIRVAGGIILGAALIGIGLRVYTSRALFAQSLQGAGLAILFVTFFAGHEVLGVVPYETAIGATVLITAASFWLASRRGDSALAVIGLLGGLLGPVVLNLSTTGPGAGSTSIVALVTYDVALLLAAMAIYFVAGWGSLLLSSFLAAVAALGLVVARVPDAAVEQIVAQVAVIVVGLALWLTPIARQALGRPANAFRYSIDRSLALLLRGVEYRMVVVAPAATLLASFAIWGGAEPLWGGITVTAAAAVFAVGRLRPVRSLHAMRLAHDVTASGLLVVGIVYAFDGPVEMLALASQAFATWAIGQATRHRSLIAFGAALGAVVGLITSVEMLTAITDGVAEEPLRVVAHGCILGLLAVATYRERDLLIRPALAIVSYIGLIAWLTEALIDLPSGATLVTLSWAIVAGLTAWISVKIGSAMAVKAAFATITAAVVKLFLLDLVGMAPTTRVLAFLGAGIVLLSFGYGLPRLRGTLAQAPRPVAASTELDPLGKG